MSQDVSQAVELLTEIRARYQQMIQLFPKSESLAYYQDHVDGLTKAIGLLERGAQR